MKSTNSMRTAKIGYLVISAVFCILGVIFICCPGLSAITVGVLCGIAFLIFGCIKLIGYFSKDIYQLAFQYDLAFGVLLIVLGIIVLVQPESLMQFFSIMLGILLLADGLLKTQTAIDAKRFGLSKWWAILIVAVLAGIFGVLLVLRPFTGAKALMILFGISFLLEGILSCTTVLTAAKILRNQGREDWED